MERRAVVQGAQIRYLTGGVGPPLLLVPGLMGYAFSWSENLAELARHYTVYAPDLLNTGWSDRIDQDGRLETSARSVLGFMDAVGFDRAHIVGSSHGGTIAMVAASMAPERFGKVVAISPANPWSEKERWQARVFSTWWGRIGGYLVPHLAPVVHGYFLSRMYAKPSRVLPGTIAGYNAPLKVAGTVKYLLAVMRNWSEEFQKLRERFASLDDTKVAFIWGAEDLVVPLKYAAELRREFPRSKFVVMQDAGHLPYEELPEEFNRVLLECLQEE